MGLLGGGTGATTPAGALANLGAAAASHTHTGAEISGNIPGNAANITGIAAIANGGTGASTVSAARTNLQVGISEISVTFNTGWDNYSSSWFLQVNKFSSLVVIRGLVIRTSGTNNTILVLPSSCRPSPGIMSICWGYWNNTYYPCRVDFYPNGDVALIYATGTIPALINFVQINATFVTANP